ncbi:MAG: cation transporter [Bacilli bacterium]|nr:cation transporter [Bacilli bacterium]
MVKVVLSVEGMRCGMCESHVADQIRKVPLVLKAKANHHKNEAYAIAGDGVDTDAIKANIESQGYEVGRITIAPYERKGLFGLFGK